MKRLLVLTPRFPYPVIGGDRLRIHRVCRELAQHFRLTLASLCDNSAEMSFEPPDAIFQRIERVYLPKWKSLLNSTGALFNGIPLQVAYYRSKEFGEVIERLIPEHDGVLCHLIRTAEYGRSAPIPRFLEMTDAISMNYSRLQRGTEGGLLKKLIYRAEKSKLKHYESSVSRDFNCSFLVSSIDLDYLVKDIQEATSLYRVAGNGVDHESLPFHFAESGTRICFIGNMTTLQNLDAATYFAAEVLPIVLRTVPDARFRVVGRIKESARSKLIRFPGVEVTGEVHSVAAAAIDSAVGVCPMRVGAGVQNKILEYMALGIPAVVSSVGLEGIGAKDGSELLMADGAKPFAGAVIRLLQDRVLARRIATAARAYVEHLHSWPAALAPISEILLRELTERYEANAARWA